MNSTITIKEFTIIYTELCAAYDKQINELTAMVYFNFIKEYTAEHVRSVVYGWISREDFFPRINRLLIELKEFGKYKPYNPKQIGDGDSVPGAENIKEIINGLKDKLKPKGDSE